LILPFVTLSTGIKKGDAIILPHFITLSDHQGDYMTIVPRDGLACNKREPDANCTFEVISLPGEKISLKGANGKIVNQVASSVNDTWFHCAGDGGGAPFDVIHLQGNEIYLHSWTTMASFVTTRELTDTQGLAGSTYAGSECLFTISEPIVSKEIVGVVYDLPKALMWDVPPVIALNTTMRNDSQTSDVQQTLEYSYQRSKVGTWNNTAGVEIGAEASFEAGVPFIASADLTLSVSASSSLQWGGSEGTEETDSSTIQITVPAGKEGKATVVVKRKALDVPFRCKQKVVYKDGTTKITDKDGVYHNIDSYDVDVKLEWEDV
jgi:hypothetical protein